MKFDLAKLPLGEALVGFVLAAVLVTFVLAFAFSTDSGIDEGGAEGEAVAELSPTAEATPESEATAAPEETPSDEETPGEATVVDVAMIPILKFDVTEVTVPGGQPVTLTADNQDPGIPHNWAVYTSEDAALGGEAAIAGTPLCIDCTETITFDPPDPGDYFFRCDVHPLQMVGTFTVE